MVRGEGREKNVIIFPFFFLLQIDDVRFWIKNSDAAQVQ